MKMKQTLRNHLVALRFNVIVFFLTLAGSFYFGFSLEAFLFMQIFIGVIANFWAVGIHIQYALRNAGEEIEVTPQGITIWKNGATAFYPKEALAEIMVLKSAGKDKGSFSTSPLDSYYYVRITTKAGQYIFITCLMSPKVDEEVRKLTGIPYKRRRGAYNFLSKN